MPMNVCRQGLRVRTAYTRRLVNKGRRLLLIKAEELGARVASAIEPATGQASPDHDNDHNHYCVLATGFACSRKSSYETCSPSLNTDDLDIPVRLDFCPNETLTTLSNSSLERRLTQDILRLLA